MEMELIKTVLKFITGESENVCRLCFDVTNSEAVSLEDSANLVRPYFEGVVTYGDMLMDLSVTEEPSMPLRLCSKCADHVTEAYLFQRLTQYSSEKLEEVLNKINSTFDLTKNLRNNVKTVHFVMGPTESCLFTSRLSSVHSHHLIPSDLSEIKQGVLCKVKSFVMQQHRKKTAMTKPKNKNPIKLICQDCGKEFSSKVSLSKHLVAHRRKRYPCSECAKAFKSVWAMKDHKDRMHSAKRIKCLKCLKMVSTPRLLQRHDDREHKATVCQLCFIQLPSKTALKLHMNKHGQYKCMVCQKLFVNRQSFQVHMKTCGKEEARQKVYCDICNQGYNWKNALRSHLKVKHGFGKEIYSCNWCDKKFDAASRLKYHIVKHTKERNFHCSKCGGMFVTQAALVYHTRLHTGEKPFKCDLCEESFLSASRRMEHKRRKHFGPQKQCPFCASKFITGHSLRKHVERHKNPLSKLFVGETQDSLKKNILGKTYKIVQIDMCGENRLKDNNLQGQSVVTL